jgi:hypothetical protein
MRTTDLQDLMSTVDVIRGEMHSDLDAHFLEAVVRAEEENPDNDAEAVRAIERALASLLERSGA